MAKLFRSVTPSAYVVVKSVRTFRKERAAELPTRRQFHTRFSPRIRRELGLATASKLVLGQWCVRRRWRRQHAALAQSVAQQNAERSR
jgi:hypothetical protein